MTDHLRFLLEEISSSVSPPSAACEPLVAPTNYQQVTNCFVEFLVDIGLEGGGGAVFFTRLVLVFCSYS